MCPSAPFPPQPHKYIFASLIIGEVDKNEEINTQHSHYVALHLSVSVGCCGSALQVLYN